MKVIVNSLPKSGTNLISKLLELSGYSYSGANFSSSNVHGRHKFAKRLLRGSLPFSDVIDVGLDVPAVVRTGWVVAGIKRLVPMQYLSGHFPYSSQIQTYLTDSEVKIIFMIRDPRDVLVSWAHYVPKEDWHYGCQGLKDKSLDERIMLLLDGYRSGDYIIDNYKNILRKVEGWTQNDDICLVRFEDLVGASGGGTDEKQNACIERVLDFLELKNTDRSHIKKNIFGGTKTFRRGVIGSWRDEVSSSVFDKVDSSIGDMLQRLGYE